jgi:hypothetical protein
MLKLCANSADSTTALYIGTPKSLLNFIKSVLNLFGDNKQPEISCISLPSKKGIWITENESKLNGKPITWWREIMTSNKRGAFLCEDNN